MSAARNTKKGPHRNQQRRARGLSDASGMSYQSALREVRRFDNLDRDETDFSPNTETLMGDKRKMNNSEAEGKLGLQLSHAPDGPALDEDADGTWEIREDRGNRYECYAVKDGQSRDFTVTTEGFEIASTKNPSCIKKDLLL